MQVFVRSLTGNTVAVNGANTVADVKAHVQAAEGIPVEDQRILFAGAALEDEVMLAHAGITDDSVLALNLDLLGGGKKRKKKTYTAPKKNKHKHKNVKLATLKFYKVDADNKVQRLRKQCPNASCGAGVFMANHFNRYYCGKCSMTYLIKGEDEE
ncbi:hypothetical protein FOZ60_008268 [Perkinsus olseni]|uniref:Ubiquitin-like domain-containing protein n=1 Tax=Perkinsus olseni TaxID=32597 RepID=A0A7J6PDX7_PEROL|nr:hypothetical protein FOZ60_008268 [Perkinsus olseni]